jgi:hypothetical protein
MAITAHFLDRQGKHQSRLLARRRQLGCHSGENLAVTLGQVVREWKIEDRVETVISDNASSNDNCLLNFYGDLDANMSPADVRARRMRLLWTYLEPGFSCLPVRRRFRGFRGRIAGI